MRLRHRRATAEYQNELNEVFNRPKMAKSLKALTVELEKLQKADGSNESTEASDLQTINDAIEKKPILALAKFYKHPLFNAGHIHKILNTIPLGEAEDALAFLKEHNLLNESHINTLINRSPITAARLDDNMLNANHIDTIVQKDPEAAAEHLKDHPLLNTNHIDTLVKEKPYTAAYYLHNHPLFNTNHIDTIVQKNPHVAASYFHNHPLLNANHIQTIAEKDPRAAAEHLYYHPLLNANHIQTIAEKDPWTAADHLYGHSLFNQNHIDAIMRHDPVAAFVFLRIFPQIANKFKGNLSFSNNTEMLRKLRDVAEANGGVLSAKQLVQLGLNENALKVSHLKDVNGNYTTEAIQKHIDSMPKHTYNFSHTTWNGDQRHSDDEQLVFQLNHTPEMTEELKNAGVYDTFAEAHELSKQSGHPVANNTLGWVRYTKGKDGNIHIDEIQSDLGRGLHGAIRNELENPELTEKQRQRCKDLFSKDKVDKMSDILFKGQHPSKILHEAFLQHLRNNGDVGKQVHVWQAMPKAKIADQRTEILLSRKQMARANQVVKMTEQNQPIDANDLIFMSRVVLRDKEAQALYKKHTKDGVLNKEAYKQDLIDHPLVKHVVNYINNNQDKITNEQENGYDIHSIPLKVEHLPVHMKVGYQETPPKMGYEQGSYGSIDTQNNEDHHNEPTWQAPLRKSLKTLLSEYEELQKAVKRYETWYPEDSDPDGMPHPEDPTKIKHTAANKKAVWKHIPQIADSHDEKLKEAIMYGHSPSSIQHPKAKQLFRKLMQQVHADPDRHVIGSGTSVDKPSTFKELRTRHLLSALSEKEGYETTPVMTNGEITGIQITAPRHSKNVNQPPEFTKWTFDGKDLSSEDIKPMSQRGGRYG